MKRGNSRKLLVGAGVAVSLFVLAVSLSLIFGAVTNAGDCIVEPPDPAAEARLPGAGRGGLG